MSSVIDKIDFGHNDAKRDHNLTLHFLNDGSADKIISGKKFFVFGRKGSGKTALCRIVSENRKKHYKSFCETLSFKSFAAEQLYRFRDPDFISPNQYQTFWRYLLFVEFANQLLKNERLAPSESLATLSKFIKINFKNRKIDHTEIVRGTSDMGFKVGLPEKFSGASLELYKNKSIKGEVTVPYNRVVKDLEDAVFKACNSGFYYLLLDELDEQYDGKQEYRDIMMSLLKVAADINSKEGSKKRRFHVIIFLRTDIVNELRDHDLNKYHDDRIDLDWLFEGPPQKSKLRKLINLRIAASLHFRDRKVDYWDKLFEQGFVHNSKLDSFKYIVDRTFHRPRDIIQFCKCCQNEAKGKSFISTDDVWQAERKYSDWFRTELIDETHIVIPKIAEVLDCLRRMAAATFSIDDFLLEFRIYRALSGLEPEELLEKLFRFSAIGNVTGYYHDRKYYFNFRSPADDLRVDFNKSLYIHRGFWRVLNIGR